MKITILTTDADHPVVLNLKVWRDEMVQIGHEVDLCFSKNEVLGGGDILFLVSCSQIIKQSQRNSFKFVLVLHASDLPSARGWSPHIWSIVRGENEITVSLLEADNPVDSGRIWFKQKFKLEGHELLPEINSKLFKTELDLMTKAVKEFNSVQPQIQIGDAGEYMQKRTSEHSQLKLDKTLADQFDLLRVVDNERYPAFFEHRGHRYIIKIEKFIK
jgi:methionyl-tRNA formyltransferase